MLKSLFGYSRTHKHSLSLSKELAPRRNELTSSESTYQTLRHPLGSGLQAFLHAARVNDVLRVDGLGGRHGSGDTRRWPFMDPRGVGFMDTPVHLFSGLFSHLKPHSLRGSWCLLHKRNRKKEVSLGTLRNPGVEDHDPVWLAFTTSAKLKVIVTHKSTYTADRNGQHGLPVFFRWRPVGTSNKRFSLLPQTDWCDET